MSENITYICVPSPNYLDLINQDKWYPVTLTQIVLNICPRYYSDELHNQLFEQYNKESFQGIKFSFQPNVLENNMCPLELRKTYLYIREQFKKDLDYKNKEYLTPLEAIPYLRRSGHEIPLWVRYFQTTHTNRDCYSWITLNDSYAEVHYETIKEKEALALEYLYQQNRQGSLKIKGYDVVKYVESNLSQQVKLSSFSEIFDKRSEKIDLLLEKPTHGFYRLKNHVSPLYFYPQFKENPNLP